MRMCETHQHVRSDLLPPRRCCHTPLGADHPNYVGNRLAILNQCAAPCPMLKLSSGELRAVDLRIFQTDMTAAQLAMLPAFAPPPDGRDWRQSEAAVLSLLNSEESVVMEEQGFITIQDLLRDIGSPSVGYPAGKSQ